MAGGSSQGLGDQGLGIRGPGFGIRGFRLRQSFGGALSRGHETTNPQRDAGLCQFREFCVERREHSLSRV
jgi:hypothetical protein